jgi:protein-S-isoprenylcysteine O-methyltransferase Ste14
MSAVLTTAGLLGLLDCFARFVLEGRGTPAPVAPTETLVVSGQYRHVRNPMYMAVVAAILGQALLFGSWLVLVYGGVVWALFHVWVVAYEEPTLRRQFGEAYSAYQSGVRRWWPRVKQWSPEQATDVAERGRRRTSG